MTPTPASNLSDEELMLVLGTTALHREDAWRLLTRTVWKDGTYIDCPSLVCLDIARAIEAKVLDRARATAAPTNKQILENADRLFPRWREDIQDRFVLENARAALALGATVAPSPAPEFDDLMHLVTQLLCAQDRYNIRRGSEGVGEVATAMNGFKAALRAALAVGTEIPQKQPPATDRNVAVGSTRFSDGKIQTKASLADEIRKSMLAAADEAIAANAVHQVEAPIQLPDVNGAV